MKCRKQYPKILQITGCRNIRNYILYQMISACRNWKLARQREKSAGFAKTYCQVLALPAHEFRVEVRVFNQGCWESLVYDKYHHYLSLCACWWWRKCIRLPFNCFPWYCCVFLTKIEATINNKRLLLIGFVILIEPFTSHSSTL